jgi:hypothetical protein
MSQDRLEFLFEKLKKSPRSMTSEERLEFVQISRAKRQNVGKELARETRSPRGRSSKEAPPSKLLSKDTADMLKELGLEE